VTEPRVARPAAPAPGALPPAPAGRAEKPLPVTQSRATDGPDQEAAAERDAVERERREFERRLKPVPEFGEGYQLAEWPGTGRHYLVYQGERIGHAAKKALTTRWEAHSTHGPKIPATGTYATRREALIQVALHHQDRASAQTRKRR
jgi:hypothetical protein